MLVIKNETQSNNEKIKILKKFNFSKYDRLAGHSVKFYNISKMYTSLFVEYVIHTNM